MTAEIIWQAIVLAVGTLTAALMPWLLAVSRRRHDENRRRLETIEKQIEHIDACLDGVRKEYWAKSREDVTQIQLSGVRAELRTDMMQMRSELVSALDKIDQRLAGLLHRESQRGN